MRAHLAAQLAGSGGSLAGLVGVFGALRGEELRGGVAAGGFEQHFGAAGARALGFYDIFGGRGIVGDGVDDGGFLGGHGAEKGHVGVARVRGVGFVLRYVVV